MYDTRRQVRVFQTRKMCECGGEYLPENIVLTTYPVQYPHKCNKCGKREVLDARYPKIEYKEVY